MNEDNVSGVTEASPFADEKSWKDTFYERGYKDGRAAFAKEVVEMIEALRRTDETQLSHDHAYDEALDDLKQNIESICKESKPFSPDRDCYCGPSMKGWHYCPLHKPKPSPPEANVKKSAL